MALVLIAGFTLLPEPGGMPTRAPLCIVCGERGGTGMLLNMLLFAPLGAGLAALGLRPGRVLLLGLLTSSVVELLQLTVVPGRDPAIGDVVNNGLGALLAGAAVHTRHGWLHAAPPRALALGFAGALAWVGITIVAAVAMRPAPTESAYFGQVLPDQPSQWDRFTGRVFAPTGGPPAIARGRLPAPVAATLRDSVVLPVLVLPPPDAPRRLAPIVGVFDAQRQEIGLLAQRGDAVLFRGRLGASALRMTPPHLAIPGVFAAGGHEGCARAGLPLAVRGALRPGSVSLAVQGGDCMRERTVVLRPSHGWMLLLPFRAGFDGATAPLSVLWLAGLTWIWSRWIGQALRGTRVVRAGAVAASVLALGAALALVPARAGLAPSAWWEWGGALAGFALGAVGGWRWPRRAIPDAPSGLPG